ncbi:hypothetical protein AB2B41_03170 [Marimonas sp. MJW-29]|uniref:Uncharacterized protein n=1 Tax=Sulfitobacter sediminis TaxID=3234186 RepID=A0ABV3RI07_9RHOB
MKVFLDLLKTTGAELVKLNKRTSAKMALLGDLNTARATCKTKEAKAMIGELMLPIDKDVRKDVDAFNSKVAAAWKKAKGETPPPDVEKKIQGVLNNGAKSMQSKGGPRLEPSFSGTAGIRFHYYSLDEKGKSAAG